MRACETDARFLRARARAGVAPPGNAYFLFKAPPVSASFDATKTFVGPGAGSARCGRQRMADLDVIDLAKIILGETSGLTGDGADPAAALARLGASSALLRCRRKLQACSGSCGAPETSALGEQILHGAVAAASPLPKNVTRIRNLTLVSMTEMRDFRAVYLTPPPPTYSVRA
jgi:hypothetical protein